MDDPGASSAPPGAAGRCRPASGPPTDHGVMTPSHAGETHSCYRQADEGDQAERPRLSAIRRGRAGVDIAAQGGMLLPSSTGPAVGVARAGRPAGPGPAAQLTRRQAQPGGPASHPGWTGGWRREGPGRPVDNGERARGRRAGPRSEGRARALLRPRPGLREDPATRQLWPGQRQHRGKFHYCHPAPRGCGAAPPVTCMDRNPAAPEAATGGRQAEIGWQRGHRGSWARGRHHAHV